MKVGFSTNALNVVAPIFVGVNAVKTGCEIASTSWAAATGEKRTVMLLRVAGGLALSAAGVKVSVDTVKQLASGK
jgi:hypothetical protein